MKSKRNFPYVILKCAVSLDGFIDDASQKRLVLSNTKEQKEIDALRATCDAILVGANTIRKDNPRLALKSKKLQRARLSQGKPSHPIKVTFTLSGNLNKNACFFTEGSSQKIVYCTQEKAPCLARALHQRATLVPLSRKTIPLASVLADLKNRGVFRLLVEGGTTLSTLFLKNKLVHELQISVAPFFVGDKNAPRMVHPELLPYNKKKCLRLVNVRQIGDMAVLTYQLKRGHEAAQDAARLEDAIELSKQCTPSSSAFSVGALLFDREGKFISSGFSRETGKKMHAEEVALQKAKSLRKDTQGGTLYSSLEPCSARLSKKTSCADLIIRAGIAKVVFALHEPPVFVENESEKKLKSLGITVTVLSTLASRVEKINKHLIK